MQLYLPTQSGGPNALSLMESQVSFVQFGACSRQESRSGRLPNDMEKRDPAWYPLWTKRIAIRTAQDWSLLADFSPAKLYYWLHS